MTATTDRMAGAALALDRAALEAILPMHAVLDRAGILLSCGPTLRKLGVVPGDRVEATFLTAGLSECGLGMGAVHDACAAQARLFLRLRAQPWLTLRGHGVHCGALVVLNLGFGIALPEAVRRLPLTDRDFAPSELAMELLFLHEANRAAMGELSRFNRRLDAARQAAELQAFTDPLTGLCNRRGLDIALSAALAGSEPGAGAAGFALAHLDLDRFKEVNDNQGHAAGDLVLQRVARVLHGVTRVEDAAARVGGDEFVLLLRGDHTAEALHNLGRRIIDRIEEPIAIEGGACRVSASIGIVRSQDYPVPDAARMLSDADVALYASKRAGRGRVTLGGAAV